MQVGTYDTTMAENLIINKKLQGEHNVMQWSSHSANKANLSKNSLQNVPSFTPQSLQLSEQDCEAVRMNGNRSREQ